jgi:hypothetical protein
MSEANRKLAKTIFKLRQYGWTYQKIADELGLTLPLVMQISKRETTYRCNAFKYPFIEYISQRTENVIRKSLGDHYFEMPEELILTENLKAMIFWHGVGDGVMRDLAQGLKEAGFPSFDWDKKKREIFVTKAKSGRKRR